MSNDASIPEVRFDHARAQRIFARPDNVKHAVLVTIPSLSGGELLPVFIEPEWSEKGNVQRQVFYGAFYAIVDAQGNVIYGSAKDQWELMHTAIRPGGYYVKTCVPRAYQATETCRVVTLIPQSDGSIKEASYTLEPGNWIVMQPGGEVQHVKAEKYNRIYFTQAEAEELGLTEMSDAEYRDWVIEQVLQAEAQTTTVS
jgi:hypothetical protein